jgi:hypothetical protein
MTTSPDGPRRSYRDLSQHPPSDGLYSEGVRQLLADQPGATELLGKAVAYAPGVATTYMALACAYALGGDAEQAATATEAACQHLAGASRRDRQHVQILAAVIGGHVEHALGLAFEHIAEFGGDPLVLHLLSRHITDRQDPLLLSELHALVDQAGVPPPPS